MVTGAIYSYLQFIIAGAAAATILFKLTTYIFSKTLTEFNKVKKVHSMVETIFNEITPNHGTSIKDTITKIEFIIEENTTLTKQIFHRQRWLLDNREEAIFETDEFGKCTWVNENFCRLLNHDINFFLENGWKNIIHEDDRERVSDEWESAVKDKRSSQNKFKIITNDGSIFNIKFIATKTDSYGYIGTISAIK